MFNFILLSGHSLTMSSEWKRGGRCTGYIYCATVMISHWAFFLFQPVLHNWKKEGNVLFNDTQHIWFTVIWQRTIQIAREETRCHHMGYSFQLTAMVLLYAPSHRQDSTYHSLCYTSRGTLAGTRNSSMGPPQRIDPTTHCTMSERSYHRATSRSLHNWCNKSCCTCHHVCKMVCIKISLLLTGKK